MMTAKERFWSRIEKTQTCWLWRGSAHPDGYGRLSVSSTWVKAHRFAWSLANGPIPERGVIAHRCDTPLCVRPDHLFLTDIAGNNADMKAKGRVASGDRNGTKTHPERLRRGDGHHARLRPETLTRGEAHPMTSLTEQDVRTIRREHQVGTSMGALARRFGVDKTSIFNVVHRRTWRHVL